MTLLSIIVPVFRNEGTIVELHGRIRRTLAGERVALEIIFVDDASDDRSSDEIRGVMSRDANVRLVSLPANGGQQHAVLSGMRVANGEQVATMDADLQDPPEALPALISRLGDSADVVFGTRRGAYESSGRLRTSRAFKWLLAKLAHVPPDAGMFLAMKRQTMDAILSAPPRPFYLPTALARVTRRMAVIPVERARRGAGVSQYTPYARLRLGLSALCGELWWRLRSRRRAPR